MVLTVGYDRESLTDPSCPPYHAPVTVDHYGRRVPKAAHGSETLRAPTASSRELLQALTVLFDRIVDRGLLVRRMYVVANHVQRERDVQAEPEYVQLDLGLPTKRRSRLGARNSPRVRANGECGRRAGYPRKIRQKRHPEGHESPRRRNCPPEK